MYSVYINITTRPPLLRSGACRTSFDSSPTFSVSPPPTAFLFGAKFRRRGEKYNLKESILWKYYSDFSQTKIEENISFENFATLGLWFLD
jgi:hypothetical protein